MANLSDAFQNPKENIKEYERQQQQAAEAKKAEEDARKKAQAAEETAREKIYYKKVGPLKNLMHYLHNMALAAYQMRVSRFDKIKILSYETEWLKWNPTIETKDIFPKLNADISENKKDGSLIFKLTAKFSRTLAYNYREKDFSVDAYGSYTVTSHKKGNTDLEYKADILTVSVENIYKDVTQYKVTPVNEFRFNADKQKIDHEETFRRRHHHTVDDLSLHRAKIYADEYKGNDLNKAIEAIASVLGQAFNDASEREQISIVLEKVQKQLDQINLSPAP